MLMPLFQLFLMTMPSKGLLNFTYHFSQQRVLQSNTTKKLNLLSFGQKLASKSVASAPRNNIASQQLRVWDSTAVVP